MATDPPLSSPPQSEPSRGPWMGIGIGLVIVGIIIAVVILSSDRRPPPAAVSAPGQQDPYAASLAITDVNVKTAENGMGGTAIYVEGNIKNNGSKTVTGATVEVTFHNGMKQVVQRNAQQLMVIITHEPADDIGALNMAPLKPGDTREFRLIFEHVSADWDQSPPEVRLTTVVTR